MTDDELRALVRDAIARHLGSTTPDRGERADGGPLAAPLWRSHASFGKFLALRSDEDSACMIEPSVQCNHCGFCQSYGH
jgi:hypothetical protein